MREIMEKSDSIPIRINISSTVETVPALNDFVKEIKLMSKQSKLDYEIDIRVHPGAIKNKNQKIILLDGKIFKEKMNSNKSFDIPDYLSHVKNILQKPYSLPMTLQIDDADNNSKKTEEFKTVLNNLLKELDITCLVNVAMFEKDV